MLRSISELDGSTITASDGDIGNLQDLYFDVDAWVIQYFVIKTGTWLSNRTVLVSPSTVGTKGLEVEAGPASLSREQLRYSPEFHAEKPVSHRHELEFFRYYRHPHRWGGSAADGETGGPGMGHADGQVLRAASVAQELGNAAYHKSVRERDPEEDPHFGSCKAITGYHIHATDGDIGHVEGLLVDERSWAISSLIVNTSNWWLGRRALIPPEWITQVRWSDQQVEVDLPRESIRSAPGYVPVPAAPRRPAAHDSAAQPSCWQYDCLYQRAQSPHRITPGIESLPKVAGHARELMTERAAP